MKKTGMLLLTVLVAVAVGMLWWISRPLSEPSVGTMRFDLPDPANMASSPYQAPDTTCLYARRDSLCLYLDIYRARPDALSGGEPRPIILFAFGGGFRAGSRDHAAYRAWFDEMRRAGWTVVSMDYRLGLRHAGRTAGLRWLLRFRKAVDMAVEDMLTATAWLRDHERETGLDAGRIVLCGSSAGAITCLHAVYALCNRKPVARLLPDGFSYAGLMAFSGAVFSTRGAPRFDTPPCPTLLLHGTADPLVPYRQVRLLHIGLFGSDQLAARYARAGFPYRFFRFEGCGHEVACFQWHTIPLQLDFLEHAVCGSDRTSLDCLVLADSSEM